MENYAFVISLKSLIQQGDLDRALLELLQVTQKQNSRYYNEVVLHSATLQQIRNDERRGLRHAAELRLEKQRLVNALLELIDEIGKEAEFNQIKEQKKVIQILFLAANPLDMDQLRLDSECRAIDQSLRKSEFRSNFVIRQHWAVNVTDVQELLLRYKPDIVHFAGHANSSSEIILVDRSGRALPVSPTSLSHLFFALRDNIRCILLNACYTEHQALGIAESIECVIGMSTAIGDSAAISFAGSFYQALGYGKDVQSAFDLSCLQIEMERLGEEEIPKLIALRTDPTRIFFVHPA